MSFTQILKLKKPTISIEVFPPKTPKGAQDLLEELEKLKKITPDFISVTYGAMGTTRDLTRDLAVQIAQKGFTTAFHLTCVGMTAEEISHYVKDMQAQGLNMALALRGDPPKEILNHPYPSFKFANELVSFLKANSTLSVAVAGYPEKHPEAPSLEADIENLQRKIDAGAETIVTQLFFDNQKFLNWKNLLEQKNIYVPILAGIMPIAKVAQVQKISQMCGATLPDSLLKKLQLFEQDEMAIQKIGVEFATTQCAELLQHNVAGLHFYGLNKSSAILAILQHLP